MSYLDTTTTMTKVTARITDEIEQFRTQEKAKGCDELYKDWYEICVKEELFEFLLNADLYDCGPEIYEWLEYKQSPLEFLYQLDLDREYGFNHQWDSILDWIVSEIRAGQ